MAEGRVPLSTSRDGECSLEGRQGVHQLDESLNSAHTITSGRMVANLVTGGLGTGMLSLPWAMAGASVLLGLVIIVGVIVVNFWTIMILVEASERFQTFDLGGVLGKLPGRLGIGMQIFTNVMVWVAIFGSLISYIISICDSALPLVSGTFLDQRVFLAAAAALVVLPLCFLDQKYLSFSSRVAVVVNAYVLGLVCATLLQRAAAESLPSGTCALGFAGGGVTMMSTMMQSVIIQMCVLPMYEQLEGRSPAKFGKVLATAFCILGGLFAALSVFGYLAIGPNVNSNILEDMPQNFAGTLAQIGMVVVLCAVYPIMMISMIAPVRNLELTWFAITPSAAIRRKRVAVVITRATIVFLSFIAAIFVDSLGMVNVIDGSICVGVFTSLGPALVGFFLLEKNSSIWRVAMGMLLVTGISMSFVGLADTQNRPDLLTDNCLAFTSGNTKPTGVWGTELLDRPDLSALFAFVD